MTLTSESDVALNKVDCKSGVSYLCLVTGNGSVSLVVRTRFLILKCYLSFYVFGNVNVSTRNRNFSIRLVFREV